MKRANNRFNWNTGLIILGIVLSTTGCGVFDSATNAVKGKIEDTVNSAEQQINNKIEETQTSLEYTAKEYVDKATAAVISDPQTTMSVFMDTLVNGNIDDAKKYCDPNSQIVEDIEVFSKDSMAEGLATAFFSDPERIREAKENASLQSLAASVSKKMITSYDVTYDYEAGDKTHVYWVTIKIKDFVPSDYYDDVLGKIIDKYADEAGVDTLKAQYESNGGDDAALHQIAEDLFYNHMDEVFNLTENAYNNSYSYEELEGELVVSKIGSSWLVTDLQ